MTVVLKGHLYQRRRGQKRKDGGEEVHEDQMDRRNKQRWLKMIYNKGIIMIQLRII